MKASELIKMIQSQIDIYGDNPVEVCTTKDKYTNILSVTYDIYGSIQIIIK